MQCKKTVKKCSYLLQSRGCGPLRPVRASMCNEPGAVAAGGVRPGAYACTDVKGKSRP